MAGTVSGLEGFALKIGGFDDHTHLLIRIPAKIAVSKFVGQLKASTSRHINETSGTIKKFGWQDGFAAFTVSVSLRDRVAEYIENQEQHHRRTTFQEEYIELLEKHEVEYDPEYLWD